jgi:hypothetical protein
MAKFGLYLGAILLLGVALLAGGCSVFFAPFMWQGGDMVLWLIWLSGLAVALVMVISAVKLIRKARPER